MSIESRELRAPRVLLRPFRPAEAETVLDRLRVWLPSQVAEHRDHWPLDGRTGDMALYALTRTDHLHTSG